MSAAASRTVAATTGREASRRASSTRHLLLLVGVALAVRLALLPFASMDTNDHVGRIFIGWRWAEDPFLFLHGRWPTLHFHLVGPVVRLFDDPILAPVLLHVAIGSLVPAALYAFALREFRDRNAALAVGLAYALYPVAIRTSLEVLAQAPSSLCLALALVALSRAREPEGGWRHAAAAGFAATLIALLRVEGWFLVPFLALTLWSRPRLAAVFVGVAVVGPVLAMAANAQHYGDPFYPITATSEILRNDAGGGRLSLAERAARLARYALALIGGLTPVLALLAGLGALGCLLRRERQAVWLVPLAGLGLLTLASAARGSLIAKPIYTEPFGLLLIPYLAALLASPPVLRLPATARAGALVALLGSMVALLAIGTARDVPGMRQRSRVVAAVPAVGAAPAFLNREKLDPILAAVQAQGEGAVVVDALRDPAAFYVALHSRRRPNRVWIAPGQTWIDLDARLPEERRPLRERVQPLRDADPPDLDAFLRLHCTGVLVLEPGSRFAAWVGYRRAPDRASVRGVELALEELARVRFPVDPTLRAPGTPASESDEVVAFRYAVAGCAAG